MSIFQRGVPCEPAPREVLNAAELAALAVWKFEYAVGAKFALDNLAECRRIRQHIEFARYLIRRGRIGEWS